MRRSSVGLLLRLLTSFSLVALLSLSIAGYLVARQVREASFAQVEERLSYEVTMTGQMMASALFGPLTPGDTSLQAPIKELANSVHTHLSILTRDGVVAADSEHDDIANIEPQLARGDVAGALQRGRGSAVLRERGSERLWVAERISRDGQILGIARASVPTSIIEERVGAVHREIAFVSMIALALGILTAIALSLSIVRPVQRVADAARNIGAGRLDTRVDIVSNDEIGDLGKAVNEMAGRLESMVNALRRNADMRRVLDTVDQGLVMVSADGRLSDERSARLNTWFDSPAAGALLWDVFARDQRASDALYLGWSQLTEGVLPLDVLTEQMPKRAHRGERTFELDYRPVLDDEARLESVLLVVTDITERLKAEECDALQKDALSVVERAMADRMGVLEFMHEADEIIADVTGPTTPIADARRGVHTLKGNCAMLGIASISTLCHEIEARFDNLGAFDPSDFRSLATRWAELRARLQPVLGSSEVIQVHRRSIAQAIAALLAGEDRGKLAELMLNWTLPSVDAAVARLADQARALAERLGKGAIQVRCEADDTVLRGRLWPAFWAAMTHAVRNAVDHGLESEAERQRLGKPERGALLLSARRVGAELAIEVSDDGRGINWAAVAERLRRAGHPAETHEQVVEGLFHDGISTAGSATIVSGRGVGMGALRASVNALGGRMELRSSEGIGTTISCRFPREAVGASQWVDEVRRLPVTSTAPGVVTAVSSGAS